MAETARLPDDPYFDVALPELVSTFARIGFLSFGGPAGQIALMHRVLVEEKRWLDETRFLHALNYCMVLPGPEAMQLATYAGWLVRGVIGGLVAGLLFVLPGAVVLVGLSVLYLTLGDLPVVSGLLLGLKAAVLAVVIKALAMVYRRAIKGPDMALIAVVAFVAIAFFKLPFPLVVIGAAFIGAVLHLTGAGGHVAPGTTQEGQPVAPPRGDWTRPSTRRLVLTVATWLAVWLLPLALMMPLLGTGHVFSTEAAFFSQMAVVTVGGAYAVLVYVAQQAVEVYGWLTPEEMLTGLGLAETTPGPLILVLVFVGFLGGARLSGLDAVAGGVGGAVVALWFTFAPCFLWIFAGAPYVEAVRHVRWLATALAAVTAAVVGVIANLALWFSIHVLFGVVGETGFGPFRIPLPDPTSLDGASLTIAAGAAIGLFILRAGLPVVLGMAALAGMAIALVGA